MRIPRLRVLGLLGAIGALLCMTPRDARAQDVQAVPGPSNLTATAFSSSRIDLKWTKVTTSLVVEYRIYYANGTRIATVPASESSYSDTGLLPWTEYRYYVTGASSSGNESGPSNVASARTLDGTPPTAPGNFNGTALSATQISLSWSAASDAQTGIDEYVVYRGGSEIGRTTSLSYQDNGLTPDRQYSYQVSAVNGQGDEGAKAGPISVQTLAEPPPDSPRDLTAKAFSASAIDLSWRAPADDADVASYRIYRGGTRVGTVTGTSYRDTELASFTVYEYRVTSVNGAGDESNPSNAASARTLDGTPPTSPGGLNGTALSQTQISLTWSAASDAQTGISEYVVYRDGGEIARTTALSYDDGGLKSDQVYAYQVSAVNGQGIEGTLGGPIDVRTLSDVAPDPPTGLTAQAVDQSTVDLAWDTHPDDDLDGYRVYRDGLFAAETGATSYRDTGLSPFTTYVYTVTAVAEDGDESAPSETAAVTTPDATPPSVPQGVAASAVGAERIDVSWSPSTDDESGVAGYRVLRDGGEIAVTEATVFQDGGLAPGTTYEYQVSAINGAELESELSSPASATTPDDSGPTVPTNLSATAISTESIGLSWSPSTDDESGIAYYRVFRGGEEIATPTGAEYQDTGLASGTTYEYRVSAVNGDGLESDLSAAAWATTLTDEGPPAPTDLTATPLDASQIRLAWTAPEGGAAGYNVFRDQVFIGTVMATAFVDTGLQPATTYLYSVASVDADGIQGPLSGQISATTSPTVDVVPPAAPTGLRLITP